MSSQKIDEGGDRGGGGDVDDEGQQRVEPLHGELSLESNNRKCETYLMLLLLLSTLLQQYRSVVMQYCDTFGCLSLSHFVPLRWPSLKSPLGDPPTFIAPSSIHPCFACSPVSIACCCRVAGSFTLLTFVIVAVAASAAPVLVQDVREAVDNLRRGMSEKTNEMKEAINKGTDKLYHVVTNNWIVQFRYIHTVPYESSSAYCIIILLMQSWRRRKVDSGANSQEHQSAH